MISFYKGTKQITGSATQLWYSTSERGVFVEMLKQHGWDTAKGPNGVGTFKESKSDPRKRILVRLTIEEMANILEVIDDNRIILSANQAAKKANESIDKTNESIDKMNGHIEAANIDLKAKGQTPLLKFLKLPNQPIQEYKKFMAFHKTSKYSTQVFFNPWDKDETQYVFRMAKGDSQNTTDSGKTAISILLKQHETRVLKEYFTVGMRDILLYRPAEEENTKGLNKPADKASPSSEEITIPADEQPPQAF